MSSTHTLGYSVGGAANRHAGSFNDQWLQQLQWHLLRVDGEVAYYRVRSPNAVRPWVIVRPAGSATGNVFRRLEHEFQLRDALDPAWAVVPTALLYSAEGPLLVLDEPGGRGLDETLGSELSISLFLQLAVGAAQALACLHGSGVLHRDLKPCQFVEGEDGVVRLGGFALSRRLDPEHSSLVDDGQAVISGSLAYMSPEQAGRLGAATDERSDLYSLGVTLYELLVGRLPYQANDAVEWLHQHLAQQPPAPERLRPDVPPPLGAIILRLLAKNPAQRYPSAATLVQVLRRALVQWREAAEILPAEPDDVGPLPGGWSPMLVGREQAMARLQACVDRLGSTGEPGWVLVSGPYGIGKSVLLRQLHQELAASPLRVAAARFEPARQSIPYAAICAALRSLVLQVLGERPAVLLRWRQRLRRALGVRAHLMLALVPEIEWVIGADALESPLQWRPAGQRGASEENVSLEGLLADCLSAFARPDKPLVLLFDDMQWLDQQSLDLLAGLAQWRVRHLLWVGAYREAAAGEQPALAQLLLRARQHGVEEIHLKPLAAGEVQTMLAGQLRWQSAELAELAALVMQKSAGNPFFVQQLLCSLVEEDQLRFVPATLAVSAHWAWDAARLAEYPVTENVLELMLARLGRLPAATRRVLGLLALLGSRADAECVTRLGNCTLARLRNDLLPAVAAGLLRTDCEGWRFSHERVREVAYRLVPAEQRSQEHTRIARLLISDMGESPARPPMATGLPANTPPQVVKDSRGTLFRIALHIQQASRDEVLETDRTAFIDVLLQAARRARDTDALPFALEYLRLARELGGERRWQSHYRQCHALETLYIVCLIQSAEHSAAGASIRRLLGRVASVEERAMLHVLKVQSCSLAGDYPGAVQAGVAGLALVGIEFAGGASDAGAACARVQELVGGRSIGALIDLPANQDTRVNATLELLASLIAPAAFSQAGLALLVVSRMVELTLAHGLCPASPRGLAWYGAALAQHGGDYQQGLRFADLASRLVARMPVPEHQASVLLALAHVSVWIRPLSFSIECDERAVAAGRSEGVAVDSFYASHQLLCLLLARGEPLDRLQAQAEATLLQAGATRTGEGQLLLQTQLLFLQRLRGEPTAPGVVLIALQRDVMQASMMPARFWWWLFEAIEAFHRGEHGQSLRALELAAGLVWSLPAHLHHLDLALYRALNLAALHDPATAPARTLAAIAPAHAQLRRWADLNPSLFLDKCLLVEAQMAELEGQALQALGLYEAAICHAASMESAPMQALAHELAARCNQQLGLVTAARSHWRQARDHYLRWGALAKVRLLEARHRCLHDAQNGGRASLDLRQGQQHLDLISVTKASQALSREVVLDRLIETLISNIVVHAGAQRGALVLLRPGHDAQRDEPRVVARGETREGGIAVDLRHVTIDAAQLPTAIVYRVLRSGQWVVGDDEGSMLCLPLLKQGEVTGLIYLDNPMTAGLFTEARVAVLELLAAQAAISLETSRLYGELLEENQRRRATEVQLRNARTELAQVNQATLMGELAASIAHEINQPLVSIVANASASLRWLNRATPQVDEALDGLRDIVSDGRRAADIVVALRTLAKQRTPNRSRLNIDEVIRQVLLLTTADIEHRHVAVSACLNAAGSRVFADGVLMQQVFYNLVVNALEAMDSLDEGQRQLTLVSAVVAPGEVMVYVEDSGNGIDPAHRSKIFDAFFTTKPTGMGMGLAICRSILVAHGGTLHAMAGRSGETLLVLTLPEMAGAEIDERAV